MCCGKAREQLHATSPQGTKPKARKEPGHFVLFEYVGNSALTVLCPVTGKSYRFNRPHDRVLVDLRDAPTVAVVPHLREIK
jgi:hypothetical protein